jgi:hypothetical protein
LFNSVGMSTPAFARANDGRREDRDRDRDHGRATTLARDAVDADDVDVIVSDGVATATRARGSDATREATRSRARIACGGYRLVVTRVLS